jgi:hypothetical protein
VPFAPKLPIHSQLRRMFCRTLGLTFHLPRRQEN